MERALWPDGMKTQTIARSGFQSRDVVLLQRRRELEEQIQGLKLQTVALQAWQSPDSRVQMIWLKEHKVKKRLRPDHRHNRIRMGDGEESTTASYANPMRGQVPVMSPLKQLLSTQLEAFDPKETKT